MRRQILDQLLRQTPFELPADLVSREEKSTISRLVAQLKQEGMSDDDIRAQRGPDPRQRPRDDPPVAQGAAAPVQDRRGRGDQGRGRGPRARDRGDGRADRRERPPGPRLGSRRKVGADSLATQILERKVIDRILESMSRSKTSRSTIEPEGEVETLDITADGARTNRRPRATDARQSENV